MGRSFANLHIKTHNFEKTIEALKLLGHELKNKEREYEAEETSIVMHLRDSNEYWISVLHDYFVWGTVKKIGKALSRLVDEPVMTAGYINEEIFELSIFENGEIRAERIFCEEWTREDYELKEERLNDDYLQEVLDIPDEELEDFLSISSPGQAVDKLSELVNMTLWCDSEWVPHEEFLRNTFEKYEWR